MQEIVYENALYEVNQILNYIKEESKKKIPKKLIEYISQNKSKNYNFEINTNVPIGEQKLLPETEAIIAIIYRDYICDENKRIEINKIINQNDLDYEKKLKEKYNQDNLFKDKNKYKIENIENLPIVIKKEGLWYRIINYIKEKIHMI